MNLINSQCTKDKRMAKKIKKALFVLSVTVFLSLIGITIAEIAMLILPCNYELIFIVNVASVVLFLLTKNELQETRQNKGLFLLKLNVLLGIMDIISHLLHSLASIVSKSVPIFIYVMLFIPIISIWFYTCFGENGNKIKAIFDSIQFSFTPIEDNNPQDLDIKLCIDKDEQKPVVIPINDRFLHMLIIGPTGCGKTSQILIPMIWQDIQRAHNGVCGLTVMEPKGDLAEVVYAMGRKLGINVHYFNPTFPDCPSFNPLSGKEEHVIENVCTTFKMLAGTDTKQYYQDIADVVIRNSIKVVKRLEKSNIDRETGLSSQPATLLKLNTLIQNTDGNGRKLVLAFSSINASSDEQKENREIASWFMNEYFNEKSKIHENSSGIRTQLTKITSNKYLRKVLNPENGVSDINFDQVLEKGECLAISTAQDELRDLTSYLGYFIILSYQSSVFRRPGTEDTRIPHFLYIDEFQKYSNPGFSDMLTQGRSYRVSTHMATQARSQMAMGGGRDGEKFVQLVSTNARNIVVFPGVNADDAKYYEAEFGQKTETVVRKGESHQKRGLFTMMAPVRPGTESVNISEETKPIHSYSDIIYREKGEITYRIIKDMKVMPAGVGQVKYIDYDINKELKTIALDYKNEQIAKRNDDSVENSVSNETQPVSSANNDTPTNLSDEDLEYMDDLM